VKKTPLLFILILALIGVIGCSDSGDETPDIPTPPDTITFGDANVGEAVYEELNIPRDQEITSEDLKDLTVLVVTRYEVNDLSGLEYCSNLQQLGLSENSIADISPLASLTNLQALFLWENSITDISPLASLTNLEALQLFGNEIIDISPLASLTNLEWLILGENSIADISPLVVNSGLADGDNVSLYDNPLSDKSLNEYLPQLEERGVKIIK